MGGGVEERVGKTVGKEKEGRSKGDEELKIE